MPKPLLILLLSLASLKGISQISFTTPISRQDSLQVLKLWNTLSQSIQEKDKSKLETVFSFPFTCSQCLDYVKERGTDSLTLNVTRQLFRDTVYRLFYDIPGLTKNNTLNWKNGVRFHKTNDKHYKSGWMIIYEIVLPSATWEGLQGVIYLSKRKGRYLITGLDTIP